MNNYKAPSVSKNLLAAYDRLLDGIDKLSLEHKANEEKFTNFTSEAASLKKSMDDAGITSGKLIDEYDELILKSEKLKQGMAHSTTSIRKMRCKARILRVIIIIMDFFAESVSLSLGILFFVLALDNITGDNFYSVLHSHREDFQILLNGLFIILASLGYVMANKRILYIRDILWWGFYGMLGNLAAWEVRYSLSAFWIWLIILCLVNFSFLSIGGLTRLLNSQVSESKDRFTIIVAVFGAIISMVALFK